MTNQQNCPTCGSPMPAGTAAGLCPACLLKRGMQSNTATTSSAWQPPAAGELSAQFPNLEILELLGRGGMGAVYKVRQKELDRVAALKILPPDIAAESGFAERFAREARALAKLNHPGIVTLYEFGRTPSGLFFFLMEFVDGASLRTLMESGRIAPREALAIVPQVCDALQYAHDNGIVHRDIKPENVLLDRRGRVKVADFGLAKLTQEDSDSDDPLKQIFAGNLTQAGHVFGTPQYMAPEQLDQPHRVDHRADIYALGVVFYQMLTGELPARPLSPPSQKVRIDVRLDEVVLRALEQTPQKRYGQASEFKTDVQTIVAAAAAVTGSARLSRTALAGFVLLPLVFAVFVLAFVHSSVERGPASQAPSGATWGNMLFPLVLCAALTTLLGWIAVSQIRRSAGRIYGMGLALFDALAYPLLAINGLLAWLIWYSLDHYVDFYAQGDLGTRPFAQIVRVEEVPIFWVTTLLICVLLDFLLVRSIWRACARPERVAKGRPRMGIALPAAPNADARISRAAVIGACCAPLILGLIPMLWVHAVPAGEYTPPPRWMTFLAILVTTISASAPFATTILGWTAVAQIRHSGGRLFGLGLALFDGLLYPILALDCLIGWLIRQSLDLYVNFYAQGDMRTRPLAQFISDERMPIFGFLTAAICAFLNVILIAWVWRSCRRTSQGVSRRSLVAIAVIVLAALAIPAVPLACQAWSLSEADTPVQAKFMYRIFEANDASLVDNLIPAIARKSAVMPNPTNDFPFVDTEHADLHEALMAEVGQGTLVQLLAGAAPIGMLADTDRDVFFWPRMADGWTYARIDGNRNASGVGTSFLGARRLNGRLQINIEANITHRFEPDIDNRFVDIVSDIRYQDFAPPNGHSLVFLVPFTHDYPLQKGGSKAAYLILAYQISPQ